MKYFRCDGLFKQTDDDQDTPKAHIIHTAYIYSKTLYYFSVHVGGA